MIAKLQLFLPTHLVLPRTYESCLLLERAKHEKTAATLVKIVKCLKLLLEPNAVQLQTVKNVDTKSH